MEKTFDRKGYNASTFTKDKSENSFREERSSRRERDNSQHSTSGERRRSFNPNFNENNSTLRPRRPRIKKEESDTNSASPYQRRESQTQYRENNYRTNERSNFQERRGDRPSNRYGDTNNRYNRSDRSEGRRYPSRGRDDSRRDNRRSNQPFSLEPCIEGDIRLNRFVAMSGVCSRRDADELIASGAISVNGEVVTELGTKVTDKDIVCHNGTVLKGEKLVYIAMNKPKGFVTTVEDANAEKTVMDILQGKVKERVFPVGRLDKNSMGVILLTNDGELTKELTHPSFEKKKIYHVFLDRAVEIEDMEKLAEGIELEDGLAYADEVSYIEDNPREIGIEIHSGKNRVIRRMFEHIGYKVIKLDRVYFASITKKGLKRGFWRYLTAQEVVRLKSKTFK